MVNTSCDEPTRVTCYRKPVKVLQGQEPTFSEDTPKKFVKYTILCHNFGQVKLAPGNLKLSNMRSQDPQNLSFYIQECQSVRKHFFHKDSYCSVIQQLQGTAIALVKNSGYQALDHNSNVRSEADCSLDKDMNQPSAVLQPLDDWQTQQQVDDGNTKIIPLF